MNLQLNLQIKDLLLLKSTVGLSKSMLTLIYKAASPRVLLKALWASQSVGLIPVEKASLTARSFRMGIKDELYTTTPAPFTPL